MFISTDNQRLNFWVYLCWLYVAIWECFSKSISLGFQGTRAGISGRQQSFKGGEGLKKNCLREYLKYGRFIPVFRGKIKVGDQSSPAEKKGRLLKTDTLIRRERVIRTLQSLMGDNVLTQPKSSDLSSPQAINSDQSLKRINYRWSIYDGFLL